ncbi:MAG TPA: hypothetical protein V6C88_08770 [Chroococcidiopsis sp.]
MSPHSEYPWTIRDRFLELHSRWMTLIAEHLQDHQGNVLEYWRIEKADSVIVLPIQHLEVTMPTNRRILLPMPSYRPGIGQATLDLPGGRLAEGHNPQQSAIAILQRELGIETTSIDQLIPLNSTGWAVNSSFSNQKLYAFVAHLDSIPHLDQSTILSYPTTATGIQQLLQDLTCLQCRAVLLEWWLRQDARQRDV